MDRRCRSGWALVLVASCLLGEAPRLGLAQAPVPAGAATAPRTPATAPTEEMIEVEDGHTGERVRIPASELGPPPPPPEDPEADRIASGYAPRNVPPNRWADGPTRCSRYGRRRYCDGPLRVPEGRGPEAELATRLGLGNRTAGAIALEHEPRATWLTQVARLPFREEILWPVDGGGFVRGLKPDRRVRVVVRRRGRRTVRYMTRPGHNGVDIAARPGTHVMSIEDGLVVYASNEMRGYGNVVLVLHSNGTVSLYAHLRAAWVFPGQEVLRGQILGEVGETGLATGPHLHFEWRRNGSPLNPVPRFTARPARPGEPEPPPLVLPTEEEPEEGEAGEPIEIEDESDLDSNL